MEKDFGRGKTPPGYRRIAKLSVRQLLIRRICDGKKTTGNGFLCK
jgi:hypothetical protein